MRVRLARLAALFRRRPLDDRLSEEIEQHIALQVEENIRRGMTPQAARTKAMVAFGGVEQTREAHRDHRTFAWVDALRQDLLFARRTLAKSPGFVLIAVTVMGLAIGANTSLFTFFNGYALKPLRIPDADRNFEIYATRLRSSRNSVWSYPDVRQIRDWNGVFSDVYAYSEIDVPLLDPEPHTAHARFVSGNYFAVLGG
jgi:hypothetical protein